MSPPPRVPPPSPHEILSELDEMSPEARGLQVCDACGQRFAGKPAGRGLLMWTRGEDVRFEEPALCRSCAKAITVAGNALLEDGSDE